MAEDYGRRLMPSVLHNEAKINPDRTFAMVARSDNVEDGFLKLTFEQLARAVNYTANWLQDKFEQGKSPSQFPTLTYMGVPDVRYAIIFYAAVQCRYKLFLPSPRNPSSTNISLLQQTQCSRIVHSAEVAPVVKKLQNDAPAMQLNIEQLPLLADLLAAPDTTYPYDITFADAVNDPVMILHSSGSTGLPKPVTSTNGTLGTYDARDWPTVPGRRNHDGLATLRFSEPSSKTYDVFPPFHICGVLTKIISPLFNLTIPIFGPSTRPPSGAMTARIVHLQKPRGLVLPPSIVEQLCHEPGGVDIFEDIDVVLFAGGPLPSVIGSKIAKKTTLCQFYGSTEMGQIRQLMPSSEDWAYFEFHPHEDFALQPSGDSGLCELVMFSGPHIERTSSLYHNYPEIKEWRTKDLFEPHPTKPNLWKFHARKDDILVFSSGEKLNPIPMESALTASPRVSGALVTGQGHPQAALLIKLGPDARFKDPINELWPAIEAANALLPGHGRVSKSMVIIATASKPFVRAGKGTVIRKLTENLYADEIKVLYQPKRKTATILLKPSVFREKDIKQLVRTVIEQVFDDVQFTDDDNLYMNGMDSIKTAEALIYLRASLATHNSESDLSWLTLETLYLNPTIDQLSFVLLEFLNEQKQPGQRNRMAEMKAKIEKYSAMLPASSHTQSTTNGFTNGSSAISYNMVLTGTTGYFGGIILRNLITNPQVRRIYCLNRSPTAAKISESLGQSHGKDIEFVHVKFDAPRLGLDDRTWECLLKDCNFIIHNAWKVDYNLSLDSFEDNFQGLINLIGLASQSVHFSNFIYISSITATGVWSDKTSSQQTVPESVVDVKRLQTAADMGYGESKRVAEHILEEASRRSGIPVTIMRMGQMVPSSKAPQWSESDILTIVLRTTKASSMLPIDFMDEVNWLSVDQAADVVEDIVREISKQSNDNPRLRVFNVVDPHRHPWKEYLDAIESWCGTNTKRVPFRQWVEHLQTLKQEDTNLLSKLPALKMLRMLSAMAERGPTHKYATEKLMAISPSIKNLRPTDGKEMALMLRNI